MDDRVRELLERVRSTAVDLGEAAGTTARSAGKYAGQMVDIAKLNMKIFDLKSEIADLLKDVGQVVYDTHHGREAGEGALDALLAQLDETFANFDALVDSARGGRPQLPAHFGPGSRLKVYVRDREDLPRVAEALDARLGERVPRIVLHAAICRRELAVEIDGVHG